MKITDLGNLPVETVFARKEDWEEFRANTAYLSMQQKLHARLEACYSAIVHLCKTESDTNQLRGMIKALEEVLGMEPSFASDEAEASDADTPDEFACVFEQLKGYNNV